MSRATSAIINLSALRHNLQRATDNTTRAPAPGVQTIA